jgi:NADPH:quinone reductase-like Zn-dependent oxidoreductase
MLMKAFALTDFDSAPAIMDLPTPDPGPGQVRIRVRAAALNGIDVAVSSGLMRSMVDYRFPVVIGFDGAGIVDAVGEGVTDISIGDEVLGHYTLGSELHHGTLAEHALLTADATVVKPASLAFTEAAALPLAGSAALKAAEAVDLRPGETVLIAGAGGGVGSFAIQLARATGATVIATGRPDDAQRLLRLGAAEVVDYQRDVAEQVHTAQPNGVDALIDMVTFDPDTFATLAKAVRPGGKVATLTGGATEDALAAAGLTGQMVMAGTSRDSLTRLITEIERGALTIDVERVLPLDDADKGLETMARRRARGKIVISVDD